MDKTKLLMELKALRSKIEDDQREHALAVSSFIAAQVELQRQLAAAHAENAELRALLAKPPGDSPAAAYLPPRGRSVMTARKEGA